MKKLTGIIDYDDVNKCFVKDDGSYFDIIKLPGQDLLNSDEDTTLYAIYTFLKWIKTYNGEYEIIGMNFPVDTSEQQLYFEHIIARTENPQHLYYLNQKLQEVQIIDKKMIEKQFFIILFYDNLDDLNNMREKTFYMLGKAGMVEELPRFYKELVCYKFNNKNLPVPKERIRQHVHQGSKMFDITEEQKKKNKDAGYNIELLQNIGVVGNISFPTDDKYVKTGTGYEACVYVYAYPEKLDRHWLMKLFNIDNAITSVHISPRDMKEVKKNINKSLGEQESRIQMASKATEIRDARTKYTENLQLYEEIRSLGEIILSTGIRIYLSASTYRELDDLVSGVIADLDGDTFKACVYLNEQESDWKAIYTPYSKQKKNPLTMRKGNPFKATTLAFGYPFHYSSLMDASGDYMGLTCSTKGPVMADFFLKTKTRKYYNSVIWGEMGSGKSTILKKQFKSRAIRGDFIRGFDVSGEWIDLVNEFGGTLISLDGTEGRINDWEVLKTAEDEATCYRQHTGKLSTIYRYLKSSATDDEVFEYENLISKLYEKMGLIDQTGRPVNNQITQLDHAVYPTYSIFLKYLEDTIENTSFENLSDAQRLELEASVAEWVKIKRVIKNLVDNYGAIFDGPTTIEDPINTQIVFYDIRALAKMKDNIFDAVLFKALSLNYDNVIRIGTVMKSKWEQWEAGDHENGLHLWDVSYFLIIVDEFHRIINARKLMAVEQILSYEREARKFFGGIWFASQSINDSIPDNSDDYGVEQIRKIFELCQYKIILQQDSSTQDKYKRIFQGEIPESQIEQIPTFETGKCIINIKGDKSIMMDVFITEEEKLLFKGGA